MITLLVPVAGFSIVFVIGLMFIYKPEIWVRYYVQPRLNLAGWDKTKNNQSRFLRKLFRIKEQNVEIRTMDDYLKYSGAREFTRAGGIIIIILDIILAFYYFMTMV